MTLDVHAMINRTDQINGQWETSLKLILTCLLAVSLLTHFMADAVPFSSMEDVSSLSLHGNFVHAWPPVAIGGTSLVVLDALTRIFARSWSPPEFLPPPITF